MPELSAQELAAAYEARRPLFEAVRAALEAAVADQLTGPHIDRISFRVKATDSFVAKATSTLDGRRRFTDPLREIEDQIAGRVIVFFRSDLGPTTERVKGALRAAEQTRRRPESPGEFGYESDHMILVIPPHLKPPEWKDRHDVPTTFELQVRTLFQHAWAEPQHDFAYKGRKLIHRDRRELAWIAASAWGADEIMDRLWQRVGEPS